MSTESVFRSSVTSPSSSPFGEAVLLDMFAPARSPLPGPPHIVPRAHLQLWREDAIHRAKNLSQLATSLANIAERGEHDWLPTATTAEARALARAYEELGRDDAAANAVPCAALLGEIASRLMLLFGRARSITATVTVQPLSLPPDIRRALLLIGSELVINALKYGFPAGEGGTVSVRLEATADIVTLCVEDDGAGMVDLYSPGHGGSLINQLASILDAKIDRTIGVAGRGYCVSVNFPRAPLRLH